MVETRDGSSYSFDYVINTLPVGVMQRNFDTLFPAGLFSPMKRAGLFKFRMVRGRGWGGGVGCVSSRAGRGLPWPPSAALARSPASSALIPQSGDSAWMHTAPAPADWTAPYWAGGALQSTYSKLFLRFPVQFWDTDTEFILQASDKGTARCGHPGRSCSRQPAWATPAPHHGHLTLGLQSLLTQWVVHAHARTLISGSPDDQRLAAACRRRVRRALPVAQPCAWRFPARQQPLGGHSGRQAQHAQHDLVPGGVGQGQWRLLHG